MVKVYHDLILAGGRTLEQVPHLWRTDVEKMLQQTQANKDK